ncbi:MAG: tetratricopeptide repeat protein [Limisphaera sp.]|nr:tetratricopeptide repeat protein [Limisphaera sp.]
MAATKKSVAPGFLLLIGLLMGLAGSGCTPGGAKALREGQRQLAAGDLTRALRRLETAVSLLPTNALAWHEFAIACHRVGQLSNAVFAYQRALQLNPDFFEARYGVGCLWLETGQWEAARTAFAACTVRNPAHAESWWRLGLACLHLRQVAAAEQAFREMQRLHPQDPRSWNGLGLCAVQRNRPADAVRLFSTALQIRSNYAPALLNLAIVYHRHLEDLPVALDYYRQYLVLQPPPPFYAQVLPVAHALEQRLHAGKTAPFPVSLAASDSVTSAPPARVETLPQAATGVVQAPVVGTKPDIAPRKSGAAGVGLRPTAPSTLSKAESEASKPAPPTIPGPTMVSSGPQVVRPSTTGEFARPQAQERNKSAQELRDHLAVRLEEFEPPGQTVVARSEGEGATPVSSAAVATGQVPSTEGHPVRNPPTTVRWWERLNPARMIRSTPPAERRPTPLPEAPALPTSAPFETSGSRPTPSDPGRELSSPGPSPSARPPAQVAAPQPAPVYPRYTYLRPDRPTAGDVHTANAWFAKGLEAHRDTRLMEALQAYQAAIEANPAFFEAYYNFVLAALEVGRLSDALRMSEFALALRPDSRDARYNFALALRRAGYMADAAQELEQLLRRYPNDTRALLMLGNLYAQQLAEPERARVTYQRFLALEPGHPEAEAVRYWLRQQLQ